MEALRVVLLCFFVSHIPATLLVDSQAVLPKRWVPAFAQRLLAWHVESMGDPLMAPVVHGTPVAPWFQALIYGELALQLPFFFVAVYAFWRRLNWIRMPALAYGVHTATTLLPILLELAASPDIATRAARAQLLALYTPYLLLPLACAAWMAISPIPFGKPRRKQA